MKLSANQSRLLKLVPAVALGGVIAVSTLFCFVDATGVATSRGEKAARSARLFWNVEQAYHSLHGAYFGEGDLGPAESPNALAVMTGASCRHGRGRPDAVSGRFRLGPAAGRIARPDLASGRVDRGLHGNADTTVQQSQAGGGPGTGRPLRPETGRGKVIGCVDLLE